MSVIIDLFPAWKNELCHVCKFLFERGDARLVPAKVAVIGEPLFSGEGGFSIAPLCGHCAEAADVDGVAVPAFDAWLAQVEKEVQSE